MASNVETYLAAAEERDRDVTDKRNRLFENVGEHELLIRAKEEEVATQASQADVAALVEMLKEALTWVPATNKLVHCESRDVLDRLARDAMEKRDV